MIAHDFALDFLPLWAFFPLTVLLAAAALEGGWRAGCWRRQQGHGEPEAPVGTMVGAMLGLLAFMLAFTFGMAAARYENRRQAFLDEVNAIGTTYLRADALEGPGRTKVRELLREYVDLRSNPVAPEALNDVLRQSEALHGQLWAEAAAEGRKHPNSIVGGLFMQSLNELIDLHTTRVNASLRSHIPGILWGVLYTLAVASMLALGYQGGLAGAGRSMVAVGLILCFSAVMWLIADLDRPQEGWLRTNLQAMSDLRRSMSEP